MAHSDRHRRGLGGECAPTRPDPSPPTSKTFGTAPGWPTCGAPPRHQPAARSRCWSESSTTPSPMDARTPPPTAVHHHARPRRGHRDQVWGLRAQYGVWSALVGRAAPRGGRLGPPSAAPGSRPAQLQVEHVNMCARPSKRACLTPAVLGVDFHRPSAGVLRAASRTRPSSSCAALRAHPVDWQT